MSNEVLDDPMDTGNPASAASAPAEDPIPPEFKEEREVTPVEVARIPQSMAVEDKKDPEWFDETYKVTVSEVAADLETIASNYAGRPFFIRARFIAKHCPPLRADALISLINYLRQKTEDVTHYVAFFNELEVELAKNPENPPQISFPIPIRDAKWIEETSVNWQSVLDFLQSDYKRHKDEGVKESTRRAMEDLFMHFLSAGKIEEAVRLYSRGIRDYCTQLKHSINMWMNWIEVHICSNEMGRLDAVTTTAFRSLKDADDAERGSSHQAPRGDNAPFLIERENATQSTAISNRQLIETALARTQISQALVRLHNRKYSQVVETILTIRTENVPPQWYVTTSDLGIYAILCAIATMERSKLRNAVGGGAGAFRKLLESEPVFIELLNSYTSSRFGRCFEIMYAVKNRLLLDPFLSRHVDELFQKIREKCVIQYLMPYSTVRMETMCAALGTTIPELQITLLDLIESKSVNLRIDQSAGLIRMFDEKDEETTLRKVSETCDRAILRSKTLVWKTVLATANIHSISDKETRQKRKQHKETGPRQASGQDLEDEGLESRRTSSNTPKPPERTTSLASAVSAPMSDDFNIVYEQAQQLEDLGDI